jgi:DNA-directed RNA polymerase subunit RPC12/RpoP
MKKQSRKQVRKQISKKTKKSLLVDALGHDLEKMSKSAWVRSMKDGKNLVCPYCNQPVQPCKAHSSAMCENMLLAGTVGKELEDALKHPEVSRLGVCTVCGGDISHSYLKKNPIAEVCPQCTRKTKKVQVGKVA